MENRVQSNLKLRGSWDNIENFLFYGLRSHGTGERLVLNMKDTLPEYFNPLVDQFTLVERTKETPYEYVINDLKNSYILGTIQDGQMLKDSEKPDNYIMIFRATTELQWDIDDLLLLANKYNLDIYLNGYERLEKFKQIIEIVDGEVLQDRVEQYSNYNWECEKPFYGG